MRSQEIIAFLMILLKDK